MESGKFTSRSLVEKYLARIEAIDAGGPQLKSVIEVNPDALALADAADNERRAKQVRGPLHGIPVLVKDNIDTADKMATTAGSLALVGAKPPEDSFVVKQLRKAGAVVLGKTNLSEWANIRSNYSTSGWSGRGGLTRNPYALDRNPCGSSSGSGAAVAANLVRCGGGHGDGRLDPVPVVGVRHRGDQADGGPGQPHGHHSDFALAGHGRADGPHGARRGDPVGRAGRRRSAGCRDRREQRAHAETDYTKFLDAAGLKGAKIGVARNYFDFHDGVEAVMKEALEAIKQAGATLIDTEEAVASWTNRARRSRPCCATS